MSETDQGGTTGAHERQTRTTRVGDSGAPVGSPLTIVLALIAVAVGLLIFRSISDDGNAADGLGQLADGGTTLPTGVVDPGQTTVPDGAGAGATTTAAPATERVTAGGVVVVINAGEEGGSAGAMTEELADLGYEVVEGGVSDNDDELPEALETSVVYFSGPGGPEAVGRSVAADLGNVSVSQAPADINDQIAPADSPGAATVFVMLGTDLSGQALPLPQVPAVPTSATPTTTA